MKTFLFAGLAAVVLGLALVPQQASAFWEIRTVQRLDPVYGVVTVQERFWVPDPVVVAPAVVYSSPVVVTPPVVIGPRVHVAHRHFVGHPFARERVIIWR
jgi:hypothetical protein